MNHPLSPLTTCLLVVGVAAAQSPLTPPQDSKPALTPAAVPATADVSPVLQRLRAAAPAPTRKWSARAVAGFTPPSTPFALAPSSDGARSALSVTGRDLADARRATAPPAGGLASVAVFGTQTEPLRALAPEAAARAQVAAAGVGLSDPIHELTLLSEVVDDADVRHLRMRQVYEGVPVLGGEIVLHQPPSGRTSISGRLAPTPSKVSTEPRFTHEEAADLIAAAAGAPRQYAPGTPESEAMLHAPEPELVIYTAGDRPRLAYFGEASPNVLEHYRVIVDAHTGALIDKYSIVCRAFSRAREGERTGAPAAAAHPRAPHRADAPAAGALSGRTTAQARDLNGVTRTLQTFQDKGTYFLVDATRQMWDPTSDVPQGLRGAIVTLDARNTHPHGNGFQLFYADNTANRWDDPAAVSAHYNAEQAFLYFERVFGRNSIDGRGGNVRSIVNVADPNTGGGYDNAFWWNGRMWYGNGDVASAPLAGSLDVGAHEMSHGVIENTANLEYRDESGALNEHFADVFAVMVDREDWQLGEDIMNRRYYPTGYLRDFADPTNGGNVAGNNGYQPGHYRDRYIGDRDNGGVHVNSGIGNHVCYRIAQALGRETTERLYYDVLANYLTRFSTYADYRAALEQRAEQRFGAGSRELAVVREALDAVGVPGGTPGGGGDGGGGTGGGGTGGEVELEVNPGDRLFAYLNDDETVAPLVTETGDRVIDDITPQYYPKTRPSVTDDGSVALLVTADGDLELVSIDYASATVTWEVIAGDFDADGEGDIRNAVISRDGSAVALLLDGAYVDDQVYVLDLDRNASQAFRLYSPSTDGSPIYSVEYADALEFDYSGRYLVYDAFNLAIGGGADIQNWDIGLLHVRDDDGFADGQIVKLFGSLEEGVNVGNPTLSKTDASVIAFDYFGDGEYGVRGIDIETGAQGEIWRGNKLGWPSYRADDGAVYFSLDYDYDEDGAQDAIIGVVDVDETGVSSGGADGGILVTEASRGTAFANGQRALTSVLAQVRDELPWMVSPNPTADVVTVFRRADADPSARPFEVFDASGARVLTAAADARQIDLRGLPPGAYVIRQDRASRTVVRR